MKLRRFPIYLLAFANVAAVMGLLLTGFADRLNPADYGWLAIMGYAFPVMLAATMAFLPVWVVVKKRYLAISVAGLLAAYQPVSLYFPLHPSRTAPQEAFEVITFNTHNWGRGEIVPGSYDDDAKRDSDGRNIVARYLTESEADVICLQESHLTGGIPEELDTTLFREYAYHDTICGNGGSIKMVVSRFPITRKQLIPIESKGNSIAAFWLDVKGREVLLINCHLEVTGLTVPERERFADMMHGKQEADTMRATSHAVFSKLLESTKIRVKQAENVADFISRHKGTPVIVCGDFNDIPQSYVHYIISDGLTDCYQQTGMGPGFTFSHYGMRVRIDNMLCSPELQPHNGLVDRSITASDHLPLRCRFTFAH